MTVLLAAFVSDHDLHVEIDNRLEERVALESVGLDPIVVSSVAISCDELWGIVVLWSDAPGKM